MATIRWIALISIVSAIPLRAGNTSPHLTSRLAVQQHLFGASPSGFREGFSSPPDMMQGALSEKKSVALSAIYSLLLPGMGELYAEGFSSGKYFLIAEGALWLTYATFEIYGNALRDDARVYAVAHAGVNPIGKDDQFYVDVGNFLTTSDYNDKKLRDREPDKLYDVNAGYAWQWESDAARATFRAQRISSETMYNNRGFVLGAILINHVASAINAARSAISHNKDVDSQSGIQVKADVLGSLAHPHGIMVTVFHTL